MESDYRTACHPSLSKSPGRVPIDEIKSAHRNVVFHCVSRMLQGNADLRKKGPPPPPPPRPFHKVRRCYSCLEFVFPQTTTSATATTSTALPRIVPRGSICRNRTYAPRDKVFRDEVVKRTLISIFELMLHADPFNLTA